MTIKPVAVLGYDFTTPDVLKAAVLLGFSPVCIYAPAGVSGAVDGTLTLAAAELAAMKGGESAQDGVAIPVLSQQEFVARVNADNIPVVIGTYSLRERDYFRETVQFARHKLKLGGRLLHPCFLSDYLTQYPRRHAIIGFPGSGNMIIQSLCAALLPAPPAPAWTQNPLVSAVTQFAYSYWHSLANYLSAPFDAEGRWGDHSAPSHMGQGAFFVNIEGEKAPVVISGLPQRSSMWANPWHPSHEPLTAQTVDFYTKRNFSIIQIVRHPLDLLVSNAAKITVLAGERAPQLLLQNRRWVDDMLVSIAAYYTHMAAHKDAANVHFIRYEDLLEQPVTVIQKLVGIIGAEANEEQCRQVWSTLSNKPLTTDKSHLWNPRADKWREFIPADIAQRICGSGLKDNAAAFGYSFSPEECSGLHAQIPKHTLDMTHLAWRDAIWHMPTGKQPSFPTEHVYYERYSNGVSALGGEAYAPLLKRLLGAAPFHDLVNAATYGKQGSPAQISDVLGLG